MSAGPDVAGIYAALSRLPGRTPELRRLDEVAADAIRAAADLRAWLDAEDAQERAVDWAVGTLRGVRLSKAARAAVAEALGCDPEELVA